MNVKTRILIEQIVAAVTAVMGAVTIFWRDWIEGLTGWDPDHHSGSAEVGIIVGLFAVAVVLFAVSRLEIRRRATATAAS